MVPTPCTSFHSECQPGTPARQQLVEQCVTQALHRGYDRLRALDGIVDGIQRGGNGPLLSRGWQESAESIDIVAI